MDYVERFRALPPAPAPNDDVTRIHGNLTPVHKQIAVNILAYHCTGGVFGETVAKDLKLVETWVREVNTEGVSRPLRPESDRTYSREKPDYNLEGYTVCEITVSQHMLNVHNGFAGGCAAHLIDISTFASLFVLSCTGDADVSGVSTAMNIIWHKPAQLGTVLRFVSTTLCMGGRASAVRCEVYAKNTNQLLISATHTINHRQGNAVKGNSTKL